MVESKAEKQQPASEIVCGKDRGYIRSQPEKVRQLLSTSLREGHVSLGPKSDLLEKIVEISAQFGQTEIGTKYNRKFIESYKTFTVIEFNDRRTLILQIEGPLDPSQASNDTDTKTPVGIVLAQPKVSISLKEQKDLPSLRGFDFTYGKGGTAQLSTWQDDESYSQVNVTSEEAHAILESVLPDIVTENDTATLNKGTPGINKHAVSQFCNDIRLQRLQDESALKQILQVKRLKYGADRLLLLPEFYFSSRNNEGVFFSTQYPTSFIPEDIFECPDPRQRIKNAAEVLQVEASEQIIDDIQTIVSSIPGGLGDIAVLDHRNGTLQPDVKSVPTNIFDKAATYLLQHPHTLQDTLSKYNALWSALDTEASPLGYEIQGAVLDGLISGEEFKEEFVHSVTLQRLYERSESDSTVDALTDDAYLSLKELGSLFRTHVYSGEEVTVVNKDWHTSRHFPLASS